MAPPYKYAYLVASPGRTASTVLWWCSIKKQSEKSIWVPTLNEIKEFQKGYSYKTHDYPPNALPSHMKVLFTFGDPYNIVLSIINQGKVSGMDWVHSHFIHLKAEENWGEWNRIFEFDAMNLEKLFKAWYQKQNFQLMTIKYPEWWDHQKEISDFLEFKVSLPEYRKREDRFELLDPEKKEKLIKTYGNLHNLVKEAEVIKVW